MINIKFLNNDEIKQANVMIVQNNIIEIRGVEKNLSGFQIIHESGDILGDYSDYKTLYRELKDSFQLSNDGSVYVEPEFKPEYVPTLEDIKNSKILEMSEKCNKIIFDGIDINLSTGEKHFSLTIEDQLNLFGKQVQLATDTDKFEYHADGELCVYYSKEDMMKIINSAMQFVSYQTTYCNSIFKWINSLDDEEVINNIKYGDEIPEEYQSEVLKDYIILMGL